MQYKHPHPVNIFENTSRYWLLLLLPILRGLLFTRTGFSAWLRGAWFDLAVVCGIIGLGFVSWYFFQYRTTRDGIYMNKGILIKNIRFIPYNRISTITVETPFYLAPFGAVRLRADTDAGSPRTADFSITMRRDDASALIEESAVQSVADDALRRVYHPKSIHVAILSLITSNTLTGVLFFSTLISQSGNILGKGVEDQIVDHLTNLAKVLAFGIPPAAAILAYVLLGGWLLSFIMNLIRHSGFTVTRQADRLLIKTGVFIWRRYSINIDRINLVEIRQSLLTRLFGFYSVFIHSSGYGKQKNELSVLIPAAEQFETNRSLKLLLPEIPVGKKQVRPKLRVLSRFLIPPVTLILCFLAGFGICYWLFESFRSLLLFVGVMAEVPAVWWLLVKIASFFHTGIGRQGDVYTFSYTYAYAFFTAAVPKDRISKIILRQSLFQKMANCCDVIIYSNAEGQKRQVVPNIRTDEAAAILELDPDWEEK